MAPLLGSEDAGIGSILTAAGGDSPGVTPVEPTPTLAAVYAAGAGDPLADDTMFMATGNYRFFGGSGIAGQLPAAGFFESDTTAGDTRIGTDYFARSYPLGAHVGGVTFDQFDGYDTTWDGTFRGADGIQHIATQVGFSNGTAAQTGPTPGMVFGREVYWNIFGFGDGTDYWPLLDANDGAREDVRWDLYNESEDATAERGRLTGWGTWIGKPRLITHGTTAAFDTQVQFHIPGGTASDDGVGWFVRNNTDDPPIGIVRWFWGGGSSGWEILGRNSGTGQPQSLLKMDPTAGAVFGVPVSFSAAPSSTVPVMFAATVDYRTTGLYVFNTPLVAGKKFVPLVARAEFATRDAALTAAPNFTLAQNAVDLTPLFAPSTVNVNASGPPGSVSLTVAAFTAADMTTNPLQLRVSVAAAGTGLTTCTGTFYLSGIYI